MDSHHVLELLGADQVSEDEVFLYDGVCQRLFTGDVEATIEDEVEPVLDDFVVVFGEEDNRTFRGRVEDDREVRGALQEEGLGDVEDVEWDFRVFFAKNLILSRDDLDHRGSSMSN